MIGKSEVVRWIIIMLAVLLLTAAAGEGIAGSDIGKLKGQTVYVPVYSHIYSGSREQQFKLAVTLSIRNTDPNHAITIAAVDYFNSSGNLVDKYLQKAETLPQMASIRYVVKESDKKGGSGANFIVAWSAAEAVNPPIIETVMIGTQAQQGISFTSRGQAIE